MASFRFVFPLDPRCTTVSMFENALRLEGKDRIDVEHARAAFKDHHQQGCAHCRSYGIHHMRTENDPVFSLS